MGEALEKALDFSNYMVTLNNQKRILQEEYQESLIKYQAGGKFSITKELVSFVSNLLDLDNNKVVLVDDNQTPILIEDLSTFVYDIKLQYKEASDTYYQKYKSMMKKRNVESLVDV